MNIIFLGKRDWAIEVYNSIKHHSKISKIVLAKSHEETLSYNIKNYDLLITCGWSEEIGSEIAVGVLRKKFIEIFSGYRWRTTV